MDEFNFSITIKKKAKTRKKKYFGSLHEVFNEIKISQPFKPKDICFIHDLRLNLSSYVRYKPKGMLFTTRPFITNKYHRLRNRDFYQRRNNLIKRMFFNLILSTGPNHPIVKLKTIQEE